MIKVDEKMISAFFGETGRHTPRETIEAMFQAIEDDPLEANPKRRIHQKQAIKQVLVKNIPRYSSRNNLNSTNTTTGPVQVGRRVKGR